MLPKAHLTSHSRMSVSRWVITPSWLSGSWRSFLYISSVYSCHLFLKSSASVAAAAAKSLQSCPTLCDPIDGSTPVSPFPGILQARILEWVAISLQFLSFIEHIFAWNVPLISLIFLKRSLVFPILLFSSISLHWSLSYLSLLFFGTLHSNGYIFPFLIFFSRIFFSKLFVTPPQTAILLFLHLFFLGLVLITTFCTISQISTHSSLGTLSIRSNPLNLFVTSTV